MKMRVVPLAFVVAAALGAAVPSVRAEENQPPGTIAAGVSLDQAVKMAEQRFEARVVRAESEESAGRTIYVLRMLNESGRVWTVRVDASNGDVL